MASRPTDGFAANRLCCHFDRSGSEVETPTGEMSPLEHENPEYLPAVAHRREIPYGRNGTPHIRAGSLARAVSAPLPAVALRLARSGLPPSVHYFTIKRIKRQKELIIFS